MRNPREVIRQKGIKGFITRLAHLLKTREISPKTFVKAAAAGTVASPFVGAVAAYADEAITPSTDTTVEYTQTAEEAFVTPSAEEPIVSDTNVNEVVESIVQETASVVSSEPIVEQVTEAESVPAVTETASTESTAKTTEGTVETTTSETKETEEKTVKETEEKATNEVKATAVVEDAKAIDENSAEAKEAEDAISKTLSGVMPLAAASENEAAPTSEQPPLDITTWIPGKADENGNYNMDKDTKYYIVTLKDGSTVIWTDFGKNGDSLGNPSQDLFLENLQNSLVKDPNFKFDKNSTTFVDGLGNVVIKTPQLDEKGNQVKMYPKVDANGEIVLDANGELIYDNPNPVGGFDPIAMFNENMIGTYTQNPETGEYTFSPDAEKVDSIASGQHTKKEYKDQEKQVPKKPIEKDPEDKPTSPEDKSTPPKTNTNTPPVSKNTGRLAKTGDGVDVARVVVPAAAAALMAAGVGYAFAGYSKRFTR